MSYIINSDATNNQTNLFGTSVVTSGDT